MTPGLQKTKIGDFIPKFSNGKNPLDMLHQNLINNNLYGNKLIQFNKHYSDPISSNIAPFVIFRDTIYSKIKRIIQKGVWNNELTQLIRQHNNANILAIPARFVSLQQALGFVEIFLTTDFEGGRHQNRIDKIPSNCC